ncbi:MAG: flagellar motor switch phosphatase FliY, partial [Lachnospiraceae bacterium]|nr:flagellar motor switch phosphatase FliY [Lachnospiraceae bacterium]
TPAGDENNGSDGNDLHLLTDVEKDAVGEISNISMGTAATTLATLVNDIVDITTPQVSYATLQEVASGYEKPCVFIYISYIEGLDGGNILVLKEDDVKIIADLMMGGDGTNISGEISEMHLSAIGEAMNQMMGSASTSLSSMLNKKVDITPPVATRYDVNIDELSGDMKSMSDEMLVKVSFKMKIGELINSEIMQMFPASFARDMYEGFKAVTENSLTSEDSGQAAAPPPQQQPQPAPPQPTQPQPQMDMSNNAYTQPMNSAVQQPVGVQPAQFQQFAQMPPVMGPENIDLIMDVPLEVTVELGRASRSIKEILDFSPGTIIELNKLAGEPVDVLVNGKLIAKGEVVVIEESFGIRVTEILNKQ